MTDFFHSFGGNYVFKYIKKGNLPKRLRTTLVKTLKILQRSLWMPPYEIIKNDLQDLLPITEATSIKIWLN